MLEHTLEDDKVTGMIQPQSNDVDRIFSFGCLGIIEHFHKQQNGNYLIELKGEIRFKVKRELTVETLFRRDIYSKSY